MMPLLLKYKSILVGDGLELKTMAECLFILKEIQCGAKKSFRWYQILFHSNRHDFLTVFFFTFYNSDYNGNQQIFSKHDRLWVNGKKLIVQVIPILAPIPDHWKKASTAITCKPFGLQYPPLA